MGVQVIGADVTLGCARWQVQAGLCVPASFSDKEHVHEL